MSDRLVSIALTTYNGEKYLRQQLDSICAQTHRDLEIVATDDCSTDGTIRILDEYKRRHGLKYSVNENPLGFVKNFERTISLCRGEFIALADQDDVWRPEKIERLLNEIGQFPLACSDVSLIDEHGATIARSYRKMLHIPLPPVEKQFFTLAFINFVTGSTCLFRRSLLERILPIPAEAISHDWWIGIQATQVAGIKYVEQQLVAHRQHGANAIGVKELWSFKGKLQYLFSSERRSVFEKERNRISYYLQHGVYANELQKQFLVDLLSHYESILSTRVHFEAFKIVLRHRDLIFQDIKGLPRLTYMLGRLI